MPNHIHLIIEIKKWAEKRATHGVVRTGDSMDRPVMPKGAPSGSLGAIIGQFKSAVSRKIYKTGARKSKELWHRNYYERIIRDEMELQRIRKYIASNPLKWNQNNFNPSNSEGDSP